MLIDGESLGTEMEIYQGTLYRRRGNSAILVEEFQESEASVIVANDLLDNVDYTNVLFRIEGDDSMPRFLQYEMLFFSQDNVQIGRQLADNKLYAILVAPDAYHAVRLQDTFIPESVIHNATKYLQYNLSGLVDWNISSSYLRIDDRR